MLRLIWKDIMLIKKTLWFIPIYAFGMAIAFSNTDSGALSASTIGVSYMFMIQACARDEKNKSEIMLNSLPIRRRDIVLAKYFSVFCYIFLGIIFYLLTQGIISLTGIPILLGSLSLEAIIGVLVAIIGMISVYFPMYFKLGYLRSNMAATIIFLGFFFSSIALFRYGDQADYDFAAHNVLTSVTSWLQTQTDWQIACYLLTLMLIIMSASILLSLRFYSKREF